MLSEFTVVGKLRYPTYPKYDTLYWHSWQGVLKAVPVVFIFQICVD